MPQPVPRWPLAAALATGAASAGVTLLGQAPLALAALLGGLGMVWLPSLSVLALPLTSLLYIPLATAGSLTVTITDGVLVLVAAAVAWRVAGGARWPSAEGRSVAVLALALSLVPCLTGFVGHLLRFEDPSAALESAALYLKRFSAYGILPLALVFIASRDAARMWAVLRVAGLVAAASAFFPEVPALFVPTEFLETFGERRVGLLLNPNIAGNYGVILINLGFVGLTYHRQRAGSRWGRLADWLLPVAGASLLVVSGSRGALTGLFASLLVWAWRGTGNRRLRAALAAGAALSLAFAWLNPDTNLAQRWAEFTSEGLGERNVAARFENQAFALQVFAQQPLVGSGVDSLATISSDRDLNIAGADSQYVDTLVETGLIGLAAFLGVLVLMLRVGLGSGGPFGLALWVNVLGLAVSGLSAFTFYSPFLAIVVWLLFLFALRERETGATTREAPLGRYRRN